MLVLAKVGLVVALLLVLIRLKWDLGLVLFLNTCLTAVLFAMKPAAFGRAVRCRPPDGRQPGSRRHLVSAAGLCHRDGKA